MNFKFYLVLLILNIFFSCNQSNDSISRNKANKPTITQSRGLITIDTFSSFPPEIDGCACYFSNSKEEFESKRYIYADNYGEYAFMKINGILEKCKLENIDTSLEERSIKTFTNNKYKITVDVLQTGEIDETWQHEGMITILPQNGKGTAKSIYGECGC